MIYLHFRWALYRDQAVNVLEKNASQSRNADGTECRSSFFME